MKNKDEPSRKEEESKKEFPVVGIGASAGGLEAFTHLLEHLPVDTGMAFVLVQHLAPEQKSILTSLLAKKTAIPVSQVEQGGVPVEPNHVYVIPPGKDMALSKMKLVLSPRKGLHTIDHFLFSLATDSADRAIGIVLSGTATDGADGLRKIKQEGGIAIAQEPSSAQYPDMPKSAIETGSVDLILTPEQIAIELARIAKHPFTRTAQDKEPAVELPEEMNDINKIFMLVRRSTGVDFSDYRTTTLQRRILRRMAVHKLEKLAEYVALLQKDPDEVKALYDDLLIKVTSFFRDPAAFEALKSSGLPKLFEQKERCDSVRIWVPGCSTGEEAYSVAIVLMEFLDILQVRPEIKILASDIDEKAITKAREGAYSSAIVKDVSPKRLQRFFHKTDGDTYQINRDIRDLCVFARHNLISDPPFSKLDIISCRNVMIYMKPELQKRLIPMFHYALRTSGLLFLGSSESIGRFSNLFEDLDAKHRIFARGAVEAHLPIGFATVTPAREHKREQKERRQPMIEAEAIVGIDRQIDRMLVQRYSPAAIIITEHGQIVDFRGDVSRYLKPPWRKATLDIHQVIKDDLLLAVRSAVHKAKQSAEPEHRKEVHFSCDEKPATVDIDVLPFEHGAERHFLIVFNEPPAPQPIMDESRKKGQDEDTQRLVQDLDECRAFTRDLEQDKEQAEEEYNAAIEELQSGNEELQSTNEELETAKEELQSTNEELAIVNDELSNKNQQLATLSDDLANLLTSVRIPMLMVSSDLRIRHITDAAERVMNLLPGDIGRPIRDINLSVAVRELEDMIKEAIENLSPCEKEVQYSDGRWYSLQVRPYRTAENKIEGAVISAMDIDALKRATERAIEEKNYAQSIVTTIREPLLVLDADLRIVTTNRAFRQAFRMSQEETEGKALVELGAGEWNIPHLHDSLQELLTNGNTLDDLLIERDFATLGKRALLLNARRVVRGEQETQLILVAIDDITERRRAELLLAGYTESVLDNVPAMVLTLDMDGRMQRVNRFFIEKTQYTEKDALGRLLHEIFCQSEDKSALYAIMERAITGKGSQGEESCVLSKDGNELTVRWYAAVLKDNRGDQIGILAIGTDITEIQAKEQQLREATKMEAIGRLSGGVAHDFNNHLTAILGFAGMLSQRLPAEGEEQEELAFITKNAKAASVLTRQLLSFGRKTTVKPAVININDIVDATADTLGQLLRENIELSVNQAADLKNIKADPTQIEQVILNVLINATDAMPEGGLLEIKTANVLLDQAHAKQHTDVPLGDYVMLSISDTGIGMGKETLAHIFEPFYTTKETGKGTGLGLATVHGIVTQAGGHIEVESTPGQGTTFRIYFPVVEEPPQSHPETSPAPTQKRQKGHETLLLVEDEQSVRQLMVRALTSAGYKVLATEDPHKAFPLMEEHRDEVALLISDVIMPGMSGMKMVDKLRETRPDLRVLYVSGYTRDAIPDRTIAEAEIELLTKPFTTDELCVKVREMLDVPKPNSPARH